ncbi:MAG: ASCH domain-containing protein [Firmicutes bacterium]|nr:ASCH domain-containing protein [Bacillota bacterium]
MKVVSIKEPFASLIKDGKKKIETRSWKTNYRGEIYIHASCTKQKLDERIMKLNELVESNPGYILCKANLKDCIYMDEDFINEIKEQEEYLYGHYEIGRYAWILDDIEVIKPIYAKGKLGIWNYNESR